MMRSIVIFLLAILTGAGDARDRPEIIVTRCDERQATASIAAHAPPIAKPLALVRVDCLAFPDEEFSASDPQLSPDGTAIFLFDSSVGLFITQPGSDEGRRHGGRVLDVSDGLGPVRWAADGRSVLGATQSTLRPSGFARGPLRLTRFPVVRPPTPLPGAPGPADDLDEVHWLNGKGLALAAYSTLGTYYRPERPNRSPRLAFIDAVRGRTLDSIALSAVPGWTPDGMLGGVAGSVDASGRAFALLTLPNDRWVFWRQSQAPRALSLTLDMASKFALTPDGKRALIMRQLSAVGVICEYPSRCDPPTPRDGPIAQLIDLATGSILWTIDGTAKTFSNDDWPVIGPDGRYALISMPDDGIALIRLADGREVQRLPGSRWSSVAMGFLADGRGVWLGDGASLARYAWRP